MNELLNMDNVADIEEGVEPEPAPEDCGGYLPACQA
jgi:hypothetical protein